VDVVVPETEPGTDAGLWEDDEVCDIGGIITFACAASLPM
jgi:hypothetical protein